METGWPGRPAQVWAQTADDGADLWVPSAADLPAWDTPDDLGRSYLVVPPWWQRAVLPLLVVVVGGIVVTVVRPSWPASGTFRHVLAVALVVVLVGGAVAVIGRYVAAEVRWHRERAQTLVRAVERVRADVIPVWALFVGRLRLADRRHGPNDAPEDIVFVFDLRVPRATLQRQRAVATAWVSAVADASTTNVPAELGDAFHGRPSVHCADVFGEQMRGVWMWRKGSVLPYEVLGLALCDPGEADDFTAEHVLFTRRSSRELRRLSRIARR